MVYANFRNVKATLMHYMNDAMVNEVHDEDLDLIFDRVFA